MEGIVSYCRVTMPPSLIVMTLTNSWLVQGPHGDAFSLYLSYCRWTPIPLRDAIPSTLGLCQSAVEDEDAS
jgi:hypothetical protein